MASRMRVAVTSTVQTRIGIRKRVIPGARILKMVAMKLTDPRIEAVPTSSRPISHRSVPGPGEYLACGQRVVAGPALGRRAAEQVAGEDQQPAERQEPEAERVDARERHVRRAELERHDVVREAGQDRHHEQEDHDRAVHREGLVVGPLVQELETRHGQLGTHHQRQDAGREEEEERVDDVQDPDLLVVDRGQPVEHPGTPVGLCSWVQGGGGHAASNFSLFPTGLPQSCRSSRWGAPGRGTDTRPPGARGPGNPARRDPGRSCR